VAHAPASPMKVLVVEDDRKLARFLQRLLGEEGYTTDVCSSGEDALKQSRSGLYDLVLLDWMIYGMDGLEVCRELRRSGSTIPILMLTARGELGERVMALKNGVDDYVVKPFEVDELLARVSALLRRSQGQHLLCVGELEIDRTERKLRVAGKALQLSTREFDLLVHLATSANQVVARSRLMMQVWSTQLESQSHLVEVGVNRLRQKLGGHAWMIETVRGRGYMLRSER
jgi:two-component system OmpR family response regulator